MIDAQQWLAHATELATPGKGAPRQVKLRRAVSAAYYALFHLLLAKAADDLIGAAHSKSPAYALVYRAFNHAEMRRRCEECGKPTLNGNVQSAVGATAFSADVRAVAAAFNLLQKDRHRADYDPRGKVTQSDATRACETAAQAMAALASVSSDERRLFLAYLLLGTR